MGSRKQKSQSKNPGLQVDFFDGNLLLDEPEHLLL